MRQSWPSNLDWNIVQHCLGSMFSLEKTAPVPLTGNEDNFFTFYSDLWLPLTLVL